MSLLLDIDGDGVIVAGDGELGLDDESALGRFDSGFASGVFDGDGLGFLFRFSELGDGLDLGSGLLNDFVIEKNLFNHTIQLVGELGTGVDATIMGGCEEEIGAVPVILGELGEKARTTKLVLASDIEGGSIIALTMLVEAGIENTVQQGEFVRGELGDIEDLLAELGGVFHGREGIWWCLFVWCRADDLEHDTSSLRINKKMRLFSFSLGGRARRCDGEYPEVLTINPFILSGHFHLDKRKPTPCGNRSRVFD